jgi:hypothetical protein
MLFAEPSLWAGLFASFPHHDAIDEFGSHAFSVCTY